MGRKKSGFPDQTDEKIRFEIFESVSWLQFLTNFEDFLKFCSSYLGIEKLLTFFLYRFMQNRKIRFSVPVSATAVAMVTSIFLITNKRCCSNILVSLTSLLGTSIWFVCVLRETQFSRQWKQLALKPGLFMTWILIYAFGCCSMNERKGEYIHTKRQFEDLWENSRQTIQLLSVWLQMLKLILTIWRYMKESTLAINHSAVCFKCDYKCSQKVVWRYMKESTLTKTIQLLHVWVQMQATNWFEGTWNNAH